MTEGKHVLTTLAMKSLSSSPQVNVDKSSMYFFVVDYFKYFNSSYADGVEHLFLLKKKGDAFTVQSNGSRIGML